MLCTGMGCVADEGTPGGSRASAAVAVVVVVFGERSYGSGGCVAGCAHGVANGGGVRRLLATGRAVRRAVTNPGVRLESVSPPSPVPGGVPTEVVARPDRRTSPIEGPSTTPRGGTDGGSAPRPARGAA